MRGFVLILLLQAAAPPLPILGLDSFPSSARDAIASVHRRAAARPNDVDAVAALAKTLHAWELWESAHQTYERLQHLDPNAFDWHYLDAVVLQRLARHADAVAALRRALAISPGHLAARMKLAEALLEAGRLDESQPLFAALAKEAAAEPAALLGLGRLAAAHGRHAEAATHLERAVKLFPRFGAAHYALARSYRALGRADEARQALALHQAHGALWPAVADEALARVSALRDDARGHVRRGTKLADEGDVAGAIAAHEAALAVDPSLADAHSNLISLYGRAGQWAKAEEHYRTVVAMGVNLAEAHYDYGVLLGLQDKWDRAADAYRQALAVNPLHAQARNNLGQMLEQRGHIEDAAGEYRTALESQPGFRLARFNLGRMLIALGRPAEAASELHKLVEPRDAEAARYLFALSVALVRTGRKEEGIKWAEDAKRLALDFGQHDLAAAIERDLERLK